MTFSVFCNAFHLPRYLYETYSDMQSLLRAEATSSADHESHIGLTPANTALQVYPEPSPSLTAFLP